MIQGLAVLRHSHAWRYRRSTIVAKHVSLLDVLADREKGKIFQPNSPVKPRAEEALRKLLKKKGISMEEFEEQFKKK